MLDNPDFKGQFDYQPYVELGRKGERCWSNFMSGNFAWRHSVSCSHTSGSVFAHVLNLEHDI